MGTGTDDTTGGPTATEGTNGGAEGSGGGSGGGSGDPPTSTTNPSPTSSSTSESTTNDGLDGSSESTSAGGFPFEAEYTGSFSARCQVSVLGTLDISVDAAGNLMGGATAFGRTAGVTGTVDALGMVVGSAAIEGLGECSLTGTIGEGDLIGSGTFSCPAAPCSGNWTLVGI